MSVHPEPDDRGSAPVEFLLVGLVLTVLTLAILQLALAIYLRNVAHDAAVEGAYHGALADITPEEGAARAELVAERVVGDGFISRAAAERFESPAGDEVEVTLWTTMPLLGLWGIPDGWEVTARAPAASW